MPSTLLYHTISYAYIKEDFETAAEIEMYMVLATGEKKWQAMAVDNYAKAAEQCLSEGKSLDAQNLYAKASELSEIPLIKKGLERKLMDLKNRDGSAK